MHENGSPPEHAAEWLRRWSLRKSLLVDGERDIARTSILIEYLQLSAAGPVRLIPDNPMAALEGKTWAAGDAFTMADCAPAPSLFHADWTHPIPAACPTLRAYRARLLARPGLIPKPACGPVAFAAGPHAGLLRKKQRFLRNRTVCSSGAAKSGLFCVAWILQIVPRPQAGFAGAGCGLSHQNEGSECV